MRMSRKKRRRLAEDREPAEPSEPSFRMSRKRLRKRRESQRAAIVLEPPVSFRMSRKRLRKLREERRLAVVPDPLENFRMTRKRLRLKREAQRPSAAGAFSLSLLFAASGLGEASSLSTMHDVPAEFQALRNAREEIINYQEAERSLRNAQNNLLEAERVLAEAQNNREEANEGLMRARLNLEAAKVHLEEIKSALEEARLESEQRTQLALACQQAVADYLPDISAQEASVQQLSAEENRIAGEYAARYEVVAGQVDELAARIEQAWESVDWQQNRIAEVQAMVAGVNVEGPVSDNNASAYESRLEEISNALEQENAFLDEMYAYLDELEAARDQAEAAEEEARDLVKDLTEQQADVEADLVQSKQDVAEAEKWQEEAEKGLVETEKYHDEAEEDLRKTQYELDHFGEGKSWQSSLDFYSWSGYSGRGHQFVFGQDFFGAEKNVEYSLSTGYVMSNSGLKHGRVSGMTDTTLTAKVKNPHEKYDVNYTFVIDLPTGQETNVNAQLLEGLAKYTSFGEGLNFTTGVEVVRHFSKEDTLTGRLSYKIRGSYEYESQTNDVWGLFTSQYPEAYAELSDALNTSPEELLLTDDKSVEDFLQKKGYSVAEADDCLQKTLGSNYKEVMKQVLTDYVEIVRPYNIYSESVKNLATEKRLSISNLQDIVESYVLNDDKTSALSALQKQGLSEHDASEFFDEILSKLDEYGTNTSALKEVIARHNKLEYGLQGKVHPGNQVQAQLQYVHAGEKDKYKLSAGYTYNGKSSQEMRYVRLDPWFYNVSYREGANVWLRGFYTHSFTPKDSLDVYAAYSHTGRTHYFGDVTGSDTAINWYEGGIGLTHRFDKRQNLHLMFSYQRANGNLFFNSLETKAGIIDNGYWYNPSRKALTLSYDYRFSDTDMLECRLERYIIHDHKGENNYNFNGWGLALMYTKSF